MTAAVCQLSWQLGDRQRGSGGATVEEGPPLPMQKAPSGW
jgi:hypothetical protein